MPGKHIAALLGVATMLAGEFLPFAGTTDDSTTFWNCSDGGILLWVVIAAAAGVLFKGHVFVIVAATFGAAIPIMNMIDASNEGLNLGIGGPVIISGALVTAVAAFLSALDQRKSNRRRLELLKGKGPKPS